jgi:hypothetical protein
MRRGLRKAFEASPTAVRRVCPVLCCNALLLFAAGCSTSYHQLSMSGGYTETELADDQFRVVFRGSGYSRYEQANDFAMLRACELTLERGFKYFELTEESLRHHSVPGALGIDEPYKRLEIRCFKEKPEGVEVLDAAVERQLLQQKYKLQ